MEGIFSEDYAALYDSMYSTKEYSAETGWVAALLADHGVPRAGRLLDLGCGTGSHSIALARLGYRVTGVDRSHQMLAIAEKKASDEGLRLTFVRAPLEALNLPDGPFDAAVMLFSVIGYLRSNEEITAALLRIRQHLAVNAVLIFDYWYGPAVLRLRPQPRFHELRQADTTLLKFSSGSLDSHAQVVAVRMNVWKIADGRVVATVCEEHLMRYFFPQELRLLMTGAGFEIVTETAFPSVDDPPNETSWSAAAVARAV